MAPTRRGFLGATGTASVLVLAGCTSGSDGGNATTEHTTTADGSATVQVYDHESLGEILVGPQEMTLYMYESDTQGAMKSTCYDSCADVWPPLVAESPTKGSGVMASLSTFEREDGSMQVAANGWPLYYFASDSEPGDAKGQGLESYGARWWVLAPDGTPVRTQSTTAGTTTSDGGGYGGDY